MSRRTAGAVALGILAASTTSLILGGVLSANNPTSPLADDPLAFVAFMAALVVAGAVGALLVWRVAGNVLGWMLLSVYLLASGLILTTEYANSVLATAPGSRLGLLAAWFSNWAWDPLLGLMFLYVPLLFPTGRPPSPRWRVVAWAGGLGLGAATANSALAETLHGDTYAVANPIGIAGVVTEQGPVDAVATVLVLAAIAGAVVSVVVRFRRARGLERQQLKWMVFAAALLLLTIAVGIAPIPIPDQLANLPFAAAMGFLPVAIGIAVLRYRLYEIDRIISRTVSYAVVAGVLAAVFAAIAVGLPQLLGLPEDSPLLVAGATLFAAGLFNPLRQRVQVAVDRRFNRPRYEAERVLAEFSDRLRQHADLDEVVSDLRRVVAKTMQPTSATVWVRESP
jgi:hypothetical protein